MTLYDEARVIGGQLNMARVVPGKSEFNETIRYFQATLERLGVDVRLGHRVTARELSAARLRPRRRRHRSKAARP